MSERFITKYWRSPALDLGTYRMRSDCPPFMDWLKAEAPDGYRLVSVFQTLPYSGRPEMPTTRECLFESLAVREPEPVNG